MNFFINRFTGILICFFLVAGVKAQEPVAVERGLNSITESSLKAQLEFFSSDWFEGREAATNGAYKAADYMASQFGAFEINPYLEEGYLQRVGLVITENGKANIK